MAAPSNYAMTVHKTEYDAENDLLPLSVTGTGAGKKNVIDAASTAAEGYYTHRKYYYRIV